MIDGAQVERSSYRRVAAVAAGCVVAWFVLVYGLVGLLRATGARPGPGAQSSLENSTPAARDASGRFLGLRRFDAAELNRIGQGKQLRKLRFVGPDVPSTGPDVVSVNAIDDFTWGAAALSDQTDRCYVILEILDRDRPQFGTTRFDWLSKAEPCTGASAIPDRVTGSDWPDSGAYGPSTLENLVVGLFWVGPVTAALAWAVVEIAHVPHRWRATLRWLSPLAIAVLGWTMGGGAVAGAVEESWNRLDVREVAGSLLWSTIAAAVLAAGAIAFMVTKQKGFEAHRRLGVTGVALLLAGLPVLLMVAAISVI